MHDAKEDIIHHCCSPRDSGYALIQILNDVQRYPADTCIVQRSTSIIVSLPAEVSGKYMQSAKEDFIIARYLLRLGVRFVPNIERHPAVFH
jgi:hypothetical protein